MKQITVVDLGKDKSKWNAYLSETLLNHIQENLKKKKKTLLYLNKRGEYNLIICQDCHAMMRCPACDVALGVHDKGMKLLCHHCGYSQEMITACLSCGSVEMKKVGVGTQQIEYSLQKIFPGVQLHRLDSDSTSNISQKKETLEHMKNADIIIGTKMMTTGFHFSDVGLIGVILLEQELQIPKFDTEEKIYSNIKQLMGRGGRSGGDCDIIIQTHIPNNPSIDMIVHKNYKAFLSHTLEERKLFGYPPYFEMAHLRYKNKDASEVKIYLEQLFGELQKEKPTEIELTFVPTLYKRDHQYFGKIILKGKNIRDFLQKFKKEILKNKDLAVIFE